MVKGKTAPVSKVKKDTSNKRNNLQPKSQSKPYIKKLKPEFAPLPEILPLESAIKFIENHVIRKKSLKR